jgi:hypothetical protein
MCLRHPDFVRATLAEQSRAREQAVGFHKHLNKGGGNMSIGFGRSFQHVGLNRVGAYLETANEKGPETAEGSGQKAGGGNGDGRNGNGDGDARPNEIWRRVTGIFPGVKQSAKERKRGLKLLTIKIQERVRLANVETEPRASASESLEISLATDLPSSTNNNASSVRR